MVGFHELGSRQNAIHDFRHTRIEFRASPDGFIIPENLWMVHGRQIARRPQMCHDCRPPHL